MPRPATPFDGPRSGYRGRQHRLTAPVRDTAAGNTFCQPPFRMPQQATPFDGRRSGYRGRRPWWPAPVRDTAAGITFCQPLFRMPQPTTSFDGLRSGYRGRQHCLLAAVHHPAPPAARHKKPGRLLKEGPGPEIDVLYLCHDVVAGVDVDDFACDAACKIAEQECDGVSDFELVDVPAEWCAFFYFFQDGLELAHSRGAECTDRAGGYRIDAES